MSSPIAFPVGADAAGGDEHVGAGARAEIEHRLALVEVGDRGGNAAAERGLDRRPGRRVALVVVEGAAEDLVAVLVGRRMSGSAAGEGAGRRSSPTRCSSATAVAAAA